MCTGLGKQSVLAIDVACADDRPYSQVAGSIHTTLSVLEVHAGVSNPEKLDFDTYTLVLKVGQWVFDRIWTYTEGAFSICMVVARPTGVRERWC